MRLHFFPLFYNIHAEQNGRSCGWRELPGKYFDRRRFPCPVAAAQNDVEDLIATSEDLRTNLTSVSQDTTSVNRSLSSLESQISSLEGNLTDLEGSIEEVAASIPVSGTAQIIATEDSASVAADAAPAQVDLTLVRILGHIARAKIHLLENDTASAGEAIDAAISLSSDEALNDSLQTAMDNLETKPAASAIALDDAWNALDALLDG